MIPIFANSFLALVAITSLGSSSNLLKQLSLQKNTEFRSYSMLRALLGSTVIPHTGSIAVICVVVIFVSIAAYLSSLKISQKGMQIAFLRNASRLFSRTTNNNSTSIWDFAIPIFLARRPFLRPPFGLPLDNQRYDIGTADEHNDETRMNGCY